VHICQITSLWDLSIGGIGGGIVRNVSRRLVEQGHQVSIITRGRATPTRVEEVDGITVYKAPFAPIYPFHVHVHGFFLNRIVRHLEKSVDVFNVHTPHPPVVKTCRPIVLTFHTPLRVDARHAEFTGPSTIVHKTYAYLVAPSIEKGLIHRAARVTAVARSVANDLRDYGVEPTEVGVVGNGVDHTVFIPPSAPVAGRERVVLSVGRLAPRKGLFDFLHCAALLRPRYPDVRFLLVGQGPLEKQLRKEATRLGLDDCLVFAGSLPYASPPLVEAFQQATVFVLPSLYEGLPGALLDALACGRAVVATNVSSHPEVITDGVNGLLVPPASPRSMADRIAKLLNDDELRERLGKAGRHTIEERFTWAAITANYLRHYRDVVRA